VPHDKTPILAMQDEFANALMGRTGAVPSAVTGPRGPSPERRFNVYRNNVFSSLVECLRARFPVVARLVGEDFFTAMARVFIGQRPPTSAALLEYGREFPDFLRTFEPVSALPYLPDVAQLEWLMAYAYHAPDARQLPADALVGLGEEVLEAGLELHPSCALLISRYPVFSIWRTNTYDAVVAPIDASASDEAVLIVRPEFEVVLYRIDAATHAFIAALKAGHGLELAAEVATEISSGFDAAAALEFVFRAGAVIGVRADDLRFDRTQCPPMRMPQCTP
jgi:hypothetical protein